MTTHPATAHYYKQFRAERPDRPALASWQSANSFAHFRDRLSADVKAAKKRTASAKKAWKTRRANAQA